MTKFRTHTVKRRQCGEPRLHSCIGETLADRAGCGGVFVEGDPWRGEPRWIPVRTPLGCELCRGIGLTPIATNDLHYTCEADAGAHEALLCVQSGSTLADPKRLKFDARDFCLNTAEEMRKLWDEVPGACDTTPRTPCPLPNHPVEGRPTSRCKPDANPSVRSQVFAAQHLSNYH